jgi:peptidoglycan/xylan/chitin deacetylase (PgdA/CDA1 family)
MTSRFLFPVLIVAAAVLAWSAAWPVAADDTSSAKAPRKIISFTAGPLGSTSVALTFDDGPHPKLTPQLLEILKSEGVPATFFMLGNMVEQYPDVARAVAEDGHELANHGHSHKQLTKLGRERIRTEISGTQDLIEEATGIAPTLFRAPYGSVNDMVRDELLNLDLELVGWAIDPRDWEKGKTSEQISAFILQNTQGGDIVLLHDIHARSIDSVVPIIRGLREKGYHFTTAGALIAEKREELKRIAEMPAASPSMASSRGVSAIEMTPAPPPVVPLGRSALKRYESGPGGVEP